MQKRFSITFTVWRFVSIVYGCITSFVFRSFLLHACSFKMSYSFAKRTNGFRMSALRSRIFSLTSVTSWFSCTLLSVRGFHCMIPVECAFGTCADFLYSFISYPLNFSCISSCRFHNNGKIYSFFQTKVCLRK